MPHLLRHLLPHTLAMQLALRTLSCRPAGASRALPQAPSACFGPQGGRIGRSPHCALALPQADRQVSREHLEVGWQGGRFVLRVISRVNGARVDDRPLPPGACIALSGGEHIAVGGSLLLAEVRPVPVRAPPTLASPLPDAGSVRLQLPGAVNDAGFRRPIHPGAAAAADVHGAAAAAPAPCAADAGVAWLARALGPPPPGLDADGADRALRGLGALLAQLEVGLLRLQQGREHLWRELGFAGDLPGASGPAGPGAAGHGWALLQAHCAEARARDAQAGRAPQADPVPDALATALAHDISLVAALRTALAEASRRPRAARSDAPRARWRARLARLWPVSSPAFAPTHPPSPDERPPAIEPALIDAFAQAYARQWRLLRGRATAP